MNYNNCEICQYNEDLEKGTKLLSEAVHASLFALMSKTEEAYEKERIARKAWSDFSVAHVTTANAISDLLQEGACTQHEKK